MIGGLGVLQRCDTTLLCSCMRLLRNEASLSLNGLVDYERLSIVAVKGRDVILITS